MEKYISIAGQIGGRWRESIIDLHDQSVPGLPRVATQAGRRGEGCWWGGVWSAGWLGGGLKKVKSQSQISFSLLSLLSFSGSFGSCPFRVGMISPALCHASPADPPAPSDPVLPRLSVDVDSLHKNDPQCQAVASQAIFFPSLHQQSNDLDKVTCVSRHFYFILFLFHSAVLPNSAAMTLWVLHSVNLISRMSELLMWRIQPPAAWILNVVFLAVGRWKPLCPHITPHFSLQFNIWCRS